MQEIRNYYAFTLGREWKLSLAELFAIFGEGSYKEHSEEVAIFCIPEKTDEELEKIFRTIGGSVRIIKIVSETDEKRFPTDIITAIRSAKTDGKITFALGAYGIEYRNSDIGLRIKKTLIEHGLSVRLVNQENTNINAASFKKEKLGKTGMEWDLVGIKEVSSSKVGNTYFGYTLACQDIDAYSHRDTAKSRDMIVGMMPPKLVQMMLNIAVGSFSEIFVYDPFCGLGTTLIEAANRGITKLIGSDISPEMVKATKRSVEDFIKEELVWQERIRTAGGVPTKDFRNISIEVFELDATKIFRHFEGKQFENTVIVSEGYLGDIMEKQSITLDRVKSERMKLMRMYDSFFHGLKNLGFRGNIVMSFPFWDVHGKFSYFTEIYEVIEDAGFEIIPLLPREFNEILTKKGSLLYRRPGQNVGREIISLKLR